MKVPSVSTHPGAHLSIGLLVALGRFGAPRWGVGKTIKFGNQAARVFLKRKKTPPEGTEYASEVGRVAALRASRVIPGANCLHRAFALRIWLAAQGVDGRVVIGFRKRQELEGHAWIELPSQDGPPALIFSSIDDGYHEVANEELILAKMRFL